MLFRSLLKQGTKSVEEYYKEMEIAMIRANIMEDEEQTMARFLNGLNYSIKKIADFQPYNNLLELVHQATKAERQVQEDYKYSKFNSKNFGSYNQASTTSATPTTSTKPSTNFGDKPSYKNATTSSRPPSTNNFKPRASSTTTPTEDNNKTSSIKCFKCQGRGHKSFECKTVRTMIINDDGSYDSMSDDEMEALEHVAMHRQVNDEEDNQVFCDNDSSPNLVVSKVIQGGTLISRSFTKWRGSHDEHEEHEREHEGKHERITQTNKNKSHIC